MTSFLVETECPITVIIAAINSTFWAWGGTEVVVRGTNDQSMEILKLVSEI